MDSFFELIPLWLIIVIGLFVLGLLVSAGFALFVFFFKVGVIVNEARKPPHLDAGDYRIEQGREVRSESGREER